jgi:hypothetical protein
MNRSPGLGHEPFAQYDPPVKGISMLPGPISLYRCTSCQELFSRRTLSSGNTLGAKYRSDGQMNARMWPQTPPLVTCPHCQALFCMAGAAHAVEYRDYFPGFGFMGEPTPEQLASKKAQEALAEQYRDVPRYEVATYSQCIQYRHFRNALPSWKNKSDVNSKKFSMSPMKFKTWLHNRSTSRFSAKRGDYRWIVIDQINVAFESIKIHKRIVVVFKSIRIRHLAHL